MCGVVGYVGSEPALPLLLEGLKRLDYRGYDSAGVALVDGDRALFRCRRRGEVAALESALADASIPASSVGIAHTRWATHGEPSDANAHPHTSCDGRIALVHNGTIDNYLELRQRLEAQGHRFTSTTDTEVLVHLLEQFLREGDAPVIAVQKMHELVVGAYGILVVFTDHPDLLIGARHGSPLLVGFADHGTFIASDAAAFRAHTDSVLSIEDGEMVVVRRGDGFTHLTLANEAVSRALERIKWTLSEISRGDYADFMLKEIMEQPATLRAVLGGRLPEDSSATVRFGGEEKIRDFLSGGFDRIIITACGTSWHAGLIGKRMIEKLLHVPVEVAHASELVTAPTPVDARTFVIAVSQSGETKDTIDAAKKCAKAGATLWAITNVTGSTLSKIADSGMYLHVGPEIGVASTKAFTAQVVALTLLTLKLVELHRCPWVTPDGYQAIVEALRELPTQAAQVVAADEQVRTIAREFAWSPYAIFLGRGYNYPTALEGALKLKEITYIPALGYPSGEMKHGPIALIDPEKRIPVIVIAPLEAEGEQTYARTMDNLEEVHTRGGKIILIASEGDPRADALQRAGKVVRILGIPHTHAMFTPVLAGIHLQLFAYHVAVLRGCNVDKPRNLAKAVTVS